jgi:hypothetical protein
LILNRSPIQDFSVHCLPAQSGSASSKGRASRLVGKTLLFRSKASTSGQFSLRLLRQQAGIVLHAWHCVQVLLNSVLVDLPQARLHLWTTNSSNHATYLRATNTLLESGELWSLQGTRHRLLCELAGRAKGFLVARSQGGKRLLILRKGSLKLLKFGSTIGSTVASLNLRNLRVQLCLLSQGLLAKIPLSLRFKLSVLGSVLCLTSVYFRGHFHLALENISH